MDTNDIQEEATNLANALEALAREKAKGDYGHPDIWAVHSLVGLSIRVRNIARNVERRYGTARV